MGWTENSLWVLYLNMKLHPIGVEIYSESGEAMNAM